MGGYGKMLIFKWLGNYACSEPQDTASSEDQIGGNILVFSTFSEGKSKYAETFPYEIFICAVTCIKHLK